MEKPNKEINDTILKILKKIEEEILSEIFNYDCYVSWCSDNEFSVVKRINGNKNNYLLLSVTRRNHKDEINYDNCSYDLSVEHYFNECIQNTFKGTLFPENFEDKYIDILDSYYSEMKVPDDIINVIENIYVNIDAYQKNRYRYMRNKDSIDLLNMFFEKGE